MKNLEALLVTSTPKPWDVYEYSDESLYIETMGETGGDREYVLELRPNKGTKMEDLTLVTASPALAAALVEAQRALSLSECHNTVGEWAVELECADDPNCEGDLCHRCAALVHLAELDAALKPFED